MLIMIQIFISVTFLISFITKIMSLNGFRTTISDLGIRKPFDVIGVFVTLFLEFIIFSFIIFEKTRVYAEVTLIVTLLIFTWSVNRSTKEKQDINCNCFGDILEEKLGTKTFIRILILGILNIILLFSSEPSSILDLNVIEVVLSVFTSVGLLLSYILISKFHSVSIILRRQK